MVGSSMAVIENVNFNSKNNLNNILRRNICQTVEHANKELKLRRLVKQIHNFLCLDMRKYSFAKMELTPIDINVWVHLLEGSNVCSLKVNQQVPGIHVGSNLLLDCIPKHRVDISRFS